MFFKKEFFKTISTNKDSFTLIELLVTIAILAVLAVFVVLVINPQELIKQGRDSTRLTDLGNINKALGLLLVDCPSCFFGNPNTIYVSIPDSSPTCANLGLPALPSGWSYSCSNINNYRKIDGTGWIPVDLTKISSGSPLSKLPVDPINTTSTGNYYTYVTGGSWALSSLFESQKYLKDKALTDGGYNPAKYEIGSNLKLIAQSEGLVGWWSFDEGSGTIAYDRSGNNNNGTLINGPTWTQGKVGGALSFDGVDDYVVVPHNSTLNITSSITIMAWIKPQTPFRDFFSKTAADIMRIILNEGGVNNVKVVYSIGGITVPTFSENNVISSDTWRQITYRYNGSQTRIFIDGNPSGSPVSASGALRTNSLDIWFR